MRGERKPPLGFRAAKPLDNSFSDKSVIEIVFALIHDQGIWVVEQQQVRNRSALLANGELLKPAKARGPEWDMLISLLTPSSRSII